MSYTRGIVPKYLAIYSIVKLLMVLSDMKDGVLWELGYKGYLVGITKCSLNIVRILGLRNIRSRWLYNLMVASIIFEACFFAYEKKYFITHRIVAEIIFGLLSCVFVLFFQPFYCQVPKEMKKSN